MSDLPHATTPPGSYAYRWDGGKYVEMGGAAR